MAGALCDFRRSFCATHFPLNPLSVGDADGGLRGNFLRKETIGRGGRHSPRRSMWLVQKATILKVSHDVANRRRAQRFLETLGNRARRHWFARLDVRSDNVRQNLAVAPFL